MGQQFKITLFSVFGFVCWFPVSAATIDDFEGYADDASLQSSWTITAGAFTRSLETTSVFAGAKAMKVSGGYNPVPIQVVKYTFGSNQDYSNATAIKLRYKGETGNTSVSIKVQLLGTQPGITAEKEVPSASTNPLWQELVLPLTGQAGLNEIQSLQIAVGSAFPGANTTMYFDELTVEFPSVAGDLTVSESDGSTNITEGGSTDTISISLASVPSNAVTVTPVFNSEQVAVSPASATIAPANWETGASFTFTAVDDDDIEGEHTSGASFGTSSNDSSYDGLGTANYTLNIIDNDLLVTPVITSSSFDGSNLTLVIPTESNQQYIIQKSDTLEADSWSTQAGPISGLIGTITIPIATDEVARFFRVFTEPLP